MKKLGNYQHFLYRFFSKTTGIQLGLIGFGIAFVFTAGCAQKNHEQSRRKFITHRYLGLLKRPPSPQTLTTNTNLADNNQKQQQTAGNEFNIAVSVEDKKNTFRKTQPAKILRKNRQKTTNPNKFDFSKMEWKIEKWGDTAILNQNDDNKTLLIHSSANKKGKVAIITAISGILKAESVAGVTALIGKKGNKTVTIGVFLKIGENYEYYESTSLPVAAQMHPLVFYFDTNTWKTRNSDWKNSLSIPPAKRIMALGFIIYGLNQDTRLEISGITLLPTK